MAQVFISYKRDDKDLVFPLKDKIEAAIGEPCWIDLKGIESDAMFVEVIMSAIDDASIFLFMYSKRHSMITDFEHDWTIRELGYAEDERKRIVFCNIDKTPLTKWFKFMYKYKQQVDMTSPDDVKRLLEDLREWLDVPNTHLKQDSIFYTDGLEYEYNAETKEATLKGLGSVKEEKIFIPPTVQYQGLTYRMTSIGERAFEECVSLTSVTIPNSVKNIGDRALSLCKGLTSIIVESDNPVYDSRNDCNAIIETATNTLITGCRNTIIPNSVTNIGKDAFLGCKSLTSIMIPNSVTRIGMRAFSGCSGLTSIMIPNSVTSIGDGTFWGCYGLTSVTIPNNVISIGEDAFRNCSSLTSVTIPNSVISIGNAAFASCYGLTSVTMPNSVTSIGNCAFLGCIGLASVMIGNNVTSIGEEAFRNCSSLTSVAIPSSVTRIGMRAFNGCRGLSSVTIPNSVTSIGKGAFPDTCKVIHR